MEKKVALLVVYNHRYDKNIPIIEKLYKNRFSHVYQLMPFYDGDHKNVIPVYDSSHYFQNYIAQAYTHLKKEGFTHFFIVADDMILNPRINENNLWEEMDIDTNDCYISRISIIQERKNFWTHSPKAMKYKVKQKGVEVENILPSREEAEKIFAKHHLPTTKVPIRRFIPKSWHNFYKFVLKQMPFPLKMDYPLVGGYSDILLLTQKEMPKFCQYCGAFAATKLFVEIAIPTSLYLTAETVKLDKDVKLKRGDIWFTQIKKLENYYDRDLHKLLLGYPEKLLFIHPVKLSRWKYDSI